MKEENGWKVAIAFIVLAIVTTLAILVGAIQAKSLEERRARVSLCLQGKEVTDRSMACIERVRR